MPDQPQAVSNMFVKAFLPGVVLGVIVGMVVGMVVVPLFDRAPQVKSLPAGSHSAATDRPDRDRSDKPIEKPADKPTDKPAETKPPETPVAPATNPASAIPGGADSGKP